MPRVFSELPPGHRVIVDAILEESCIDTYQTVMYGRAIFSPAGKEISFAYMRAPLVYLSKSLPWEARTDNQKAFARQVQNPHLIAQPNRS
jgi:hypothetical protein